MSTIRDRDSSPIRLYIYGFIRVVLSRHPAKSPDRQSSTIGAAPREGAASRPPHRGGRPATLVTPSICAPPGPPAGPTPAGGGRPPPSLHCEGGGPTAERLCHGLRAGTSKLPRPSHLGWWVRWWRGCTACKVADRLSEGRRCPPVGDPGRSLTWGVRRRPGGSVEQFE